MKITFFEITPLAKLFPPVLAKKEVPDWYKEIESSLANVQQLAVGTTGSVKKCMPVLDYITTGYMLRTHMDIVVKRSWSDNHGEEFNVDFKMTDSPPIAFHSNKQLSVFRNGHAKKIGKFNGMWGIETPPGYSCLFYQPEYLQETRFKIFPGIVDTDQYTDPVSFPFMFSDSLDTEEFIIEAGTPIACVFPFKREEWTHEIKPVIPGTRTSILMRTIWQSAYRKFMHTKKSFN
jgi:hypothetical protein